MKTTSRETPTITLKRVLHRSQEQLFLLFKYYEPFIIVLRNHPDFKWSKTQKGWYTIFTSTNVSLISKIFPQATLKIDSSITTNSLPILNTKIQKRVAKKKELILLFSKYLKGQKYSETSISTYTTMITGFINSIANKSLNELTIKDLEYFIEGTIVSNKWNMHSQKQLFSAIKLFKSFYPECNINEVELERIFKKMSKSI